MHSLKQKKRARTESETGKGVPTQGWKPSIVVWALCLLVRKSSRPKTHPCEDLGVERLHMRLPFLAFHPPPILTHFLKQQMKRIKSSRKIAHLELGGEIWSHGVGVVPKPPIIWVWFAASPSF